VLAPPKSVVVITPVDEFKVQLACEAFVKTLVVSLKVTVSPEAATVATVPEKFPAIVPNEPADVVQPGASDTVKSADELLTALPSLFSTLMKYVPSTVKVKFAVIDVALENETELAMVTAPVELIASTCGTDTKLVPVITTLVASFVIVDGLIPEIVGLVSPTVTDPPRETAEPLIVIAEFAKAAFAIPPPALAVSVPPTVKFAPEGTVIVSPLSPS
jgi:hypothetical protein